MEAQMCDVTKATKHISKVNFCHVNVIVSHYKKYKNFDLDATLKNRLSKFCKDILLYSLLTASSSINVSGNKLARIHGIVHVIIQRIGIQNDHSTGIVSQSTSINIKSVHSEDYYKFSQETSSKDCRLGGLDLEMKRVMQLINLNRITSSLLHRPVGVMIHGSPGVGKTSFVRKIAFESGAVLFRVDSIELLKSELGAGPESLRNIFKKAVDLLEEGPVILFIDEMDVVCPRPENASMGNKQLSSALMAEMDSLQRKNVAGLIVLSTSNAISSIDTVLRRPGRFDHEIFINVPSQQQRVSIMQALTADLHLSSDICFTHLAQRTPGFVGADLQHLCQEALNQAVSDKEDGKPLVTLTVSNFESALYKVVPSLKKSSDCVVDLRPTSWEEIGGLDDVKAEVQQSIEWPLLYPEALREMDISPTRGLLLYGPPGCCKTTIVRAAATSTNVSFLSLSGAQVYSPYVGESERIISEAFQKARALAPSILFFDEIETLVGMRKSGSGQSRVQERILSTLLNEMDGVGTRLDQRINVSSMQEDRNLKSFVQETESSSTMAEEKGLPEKLLHKSRNSMGVMLVGATNRPDMLDAAILRPGRLDKHIYVPPPDMEARKAILKLYVDKMSTADHVDIDTLSKMTELYTGADLKNVCKEAGLVAFREQLSKRGDLDIFQISQGHFIQALNTVKASLTNETLKQYQAKGR